MASALPHPLLSRSSVESTDLAFGRHDERDGFVRERNGEPMQALEQKSPHLDRHARVFHFFKASRVGEQRVALFQLCLGLTKQQEPSSAGIAAVFIRLRDACLCSLNTIEYPLKDRKIAENWIVRGNRVSACAHQENARAKWAGDASASLESSRKDLATLAVMLGDELVAASTKGMRPSRVHLSRTIDKILR